MIQRPKCGRLRGLAKKREPAPARGSKMRVHKIIEEGERKLGEERCG